MRTVRVFFLTCMIIPCLTFSETLLLKDDFSVSLTSQDLPNSAQWFATNPRLVKRKQITQGVYALSLGTGDALRAATAYFTPLDEAVSLTDESKKLRVTAEITPVSVNPADEANAFRVVLGHSGESRMTADGIGAVTMSGYMIALNAGQGGVTFRYRDQATGNTVSTIGNYSNMKSKREKFVLKKDTTYSVTIEIELVENGNVQLTYTIGDGTDSMSCSYVDSRKKLVNFDTLCFGKSSEIGVLNVQDVTVSLH